ncbi:signal peptidase I [Methanobacterium alcaliphilum]|uniref:signal peptidase I n=1 Tax=Methanobacterium alcaliphilum TaxID=392018 RepID=UPI00200A0321|nr:signal peptidase I [Methanobacterium alcaliphilum]MCK9152575.1 signal peptidase I [Methanobacterium alcaliphilum]
MTDTNNEFKEIAIYTIIVVIGLFASQHMNVVTSQSMEPVFYRGDIVIIEKTNYMGFSEFSTDDIKVGDIVIYNATWFKDGPVIHRVIGIGTDNTGNKFFIIKGDNNPKIDPNIAYPSQILSRVIKLGDTPLTIPRIGYITLELRGL